MKKLKTMIALFSVALFASCGTAPNPVEYNNKLMTLMNGNEKNMNAMNEAMTGGDYTKAEAVRKTWADELGKSIGEVDKLPAIKDDAGLKSAVAEGLKGYKKIADESYKTLIDLRTKEKGGDTTVQPQIQATLNTINSSFDAIGEKINKASNEFEKKFSK
ncbi:hypothetical protein EGT74_03320 [Chitinophaga lutea]|uniref:Lipoprotein n=1 Tax=Chitinophaga lutea TaxID=2488634 RepID=A0A3N4QLP1_9BACT|nr:hypothetical protein [Chitinophaga lutea]RPE12594.1 hypothetical protein EGT74_03320 [Chitinophaga lutea]